MTRTYVVHKICDRSVFYTGQPVQFEAYGILEPGEIVIATGAMHEAYIEILTSKGLVWVLYNHHMVKL